MTLRIAATMLAAIAVLATSPAAAQPPQCPAQPPTKAGVIAAEQAWVHALESRDQQALACILAPEFTDNSWRGRVVPRKVVLDRLLSRPAASLNLTDLRVFKDDRIAVVTGTNSQTSPDAQSSGSVRFTDVFVYRDGGWRAVSAQETLAAASR